MPVSGEAEFLVDEGEDVVGGGLVERVPHGGHPRFAALEGGQGVEEGLQP
ncbi:hypothetical protein [Streptomyces sp. RKAG290]|nr:hypothetical protein [Streptomyces sp. RKAG290]MCM2411575.1 hypothetical protein [Streptomyces sp. RKAG290]